MRGKILLIGLGFSLVVNAFCIFALNDFNHRYAELWAQRGQAENKAKELQSQLDFERAMAATAAPQRTPALDALINQSNAEIERARQADQTTSLLHQQQDTLEQIRIQLAYPPIR